MTKAFLQYDDDRAYGVYGAYTSLVYATPFIGGMLADRLLGARKAVVLGGLLMAAGHLAMTVENHLVFFGALGLLIAGNGFFKPNISTIVGSLYPDGSPKRDAGFTLFYMGINLGAALAPLLCGYIGETYGWHYGFGLATIGMLIGLAVFVAPTRVTQALIGLGALGAAGTMLWSGMSDTVMLVVNAPVGIALLAAAAVALMALQRGPLPAEAGAPPSVEALKKPIAGLPTEWVVYLGALVAVPVLALLVNRDALAGWVLNIFGVLALAFIAVNALRSTKVERDRLAFITVMMFFSMLFWAFFEQAGSSINNFTDRNVDRVLEESQVTPAMVGTEIEVKLTQEQLGLPVGGKPLVLPDLDAARAGGKDSVRLTVAPEHVGMGLGGSEIKASVFQAANPVFILVFGLVFTGLWGFLGARRMEPSTPVKFGLGLLQLGLGFGALWYGAVHADSRGMVGMSWLLLGYLLHTTGELCLSPVGLSMVTKLSPARLVSTMMGAWFLATAFSGYLAGQIARLTGVSEHGDGGSSVPVPLDTVAVYGGVFGQIGVAACVSAVLVLALTPLLKKWMHEGEEMGAAHAGH
jgi:POT family proton-dependent oligopeptide transporter